MASDLERQAYHGEVAAERVKLLREVDDLLRSAQDARDQVATGGTLTVSEARRLAAVAAEVVSLTAVVVALERVRFLADGAS